MLVDDCRDGLATRRAELRERNKEKHFSFGFIDSEGKRVKAPLWVARDIPLDAGEQDTDWMDDVVEGREMVTNDHGP